MSSKRVREDKDIQLPVVSLALERIKVDEAKNLRRFNPDAKAVEDLARSILSEGMINPVLVREVTVDNALYTHQYELVAGYQRMKALAYLNDNGHRVEAVQASVVTVDLEKPNQAKILNLMENLRRNELSYIDAAYVIKDLQDSGMTNVDISKEFGKSGAWISYVSKMLTLRPGVQKKIHEGAVNWQTARRLPDMTEEEQDEAVSQKDTKTAQGVAEEAKKKKGRKNKRGRKAREDSAEGRNLSSKQAVLQFEGMVKELVEAEGKKTKADESAIELYGNLVKFLTGALGVKAFHNRLMKTL